MAEYLDRYEKFRTNTGTTIVPNIKLPVMESDKSVVYRVGRTRMDRLSQDYYGNPYHGWLIMLANPQFGGMEFGIPDQTVIKIPFPFKVAAKNYTAAVDNYILLNGR